MRLIQFGVLAAAWALAAPANAVFIEFDLAETTVSPGDSLVVDIVVGDLEADNERVTGFDLFIGYDASVITPVAVALGPDPSALFTEDTSFVVGDTFDLGMALLGATGLSVPGPLSLSALSFGGSQGDTALLGRLTFDVLTSGLSALTFLPHPILGIAANVTGNDAFGVMAFDEIRTSLITVEDPAPPAPVPAPGTLVLLVTALWLLVGTLASGRRALATREA